jgi:chromatin remodeling complex protein RSC6
MYIKTLHVCNVYMSTNTSTKINEENNTNSPIQSNTESLIESQFSSILTNVSNFKLQVTTLSTQLKNLEKMVKKERNTHKKFANKKMSTGIKKPSGFAAASPISNELCDFMGMPYGTEIARTEVTKFICSYIKQQSLTTTDNNKIIKPDAKLHMLLGTDEKSVVTYFNIQKYMNNHYVKNPDNKVEV